MGYSSRAEGKFTFEPPLTYREIQALPPHLAQTGDKTANEHGREAYIKIRARKTETDDGITVVYSADTIVPTAPDEDFKRYDLEEHLQQILEALPGRTVTGIIEQRGEDGDRWAYGIRDGALVTLRAKITWVEEGSPEDTGDN